MQEETFSNLRKLLSDDRLNSLVPAGGDQSTVVRYYVENVLLCESFYPVLHLFEVGLRNSIDHGFTMKWGKSWIEDPGALPLGKREIDQLERTRNQIREAGKDVTRSRIVAGLSLGFWTGLLSPYYDHQWHGSVIRNVCPGLRGSARTRATVANTVSRVRVFRNNVFHHDRIRHLDLRAKHHDIIQVVEWLGSDLVKLVNIVDGFDLVFDRVSSLAERLVARIDNNT